VRNEVEINSIAAYLFANAERHEFAVKNPPHGDAKNGEQIVKSIGCLGCHVVGEGKRSEIGPRRTFGQPLENIGNKTTYEWIYNWVRDPKHYSPSTYMPNLRLTDPQVADVATYLTGLTGPPATRPKATPDAKVADDVLLDYLKNVMPFEDAKAQLAKWKPGAETASSSGSASSAGTAASAATRSKASRKPVDRNESVRGRQQAGHAPRFLRSSPTSRTRRKPRGSGRSFTTAHLRQGARAAAAREAAHAELGLHR